MKSNTNSKLKKGISKIKGTQLRPRLSVFRSNKFTYAQVIDDQNGKTLLSASEVELRKDGKRMEKAKELGMLIAKKALSKKIKNVVFDRSSYKYHGIVRQLAEGAREGGLIF